MNTKQTITEECNRVNVIPPDQFFHKSTTHPLIKFSNDISNKINRETPTIACSLDVEKAYDTVCTDRLTYNMHRIFGFNTHICRLITNYQAGRSFKVVVESNQSQAFPIAAGVPQGGVLSSLLYIIYTYDIPSPYINETEEKYLPRSTRTKLSQLC